MPDIDTKLAQLETESLETHVAVAHERFKNLDQSIHRPVSYTHLTLPTSG